MNRALKVVLIVVAVVVVAGGSFYGGMVYGKGQAQPSFPGGRQSRQFFQGTPGADQAGSGQGGMLVGEIQAISNGDLTITDQRGQQTVVHVTDTTLIQKQASVTVADLQQGENVMVSGSRGTDGSITARSVQVVSGEGFPGGPGFIQSGTGQPPGSSTNP